MMMKKTIIAWCAVILGCAAACAAGGTESEKLIDQLERKGFTTHFVHRRTAKN